MGLRTNQPVYNNGEDVRDVALEHPIPLAEKKKCITLARLVHYSVARVRVVAFVLVGGDKGTFPSSQSSSSNQYTM